MALPTHTHPDTDTHITHSRPDYFCIYELGEGTGLGNQTDRTAVWNTNMGVDPGPLTQANALVLGNAKLEREARHDIMK